LGPGIAGWHRVVLVDSLASPDTMASGMGSTFTTAWVSIQRGCRAAPGWTADHDHKRCV